MTSSIVEKQGRIYVRLRWTDVVTGKTRELYRRAQTRTEAKELRRRMLLEHDQGGTELLDSETLLFAEAAKRYAEHRLIPAEYVGNRKVAGLRSLAPQKLNLKTLVAYFGQRRLRVITPADIATFKRERLKVPTIHKRQRSITAVNRELEVLRAMFNFCVRQGWLLQSPFSRGEQLISKADETHRERILTEDEERRLLAACSRRRAHLRPLVIAAVDTGMRRGELFCLQWRDVNLEQGLITVRSETTKTARSRVVGLTPRLKAELTELARLSIGDPLGSVFGLTSNIKRSWASACKQAELTDLKFHDLRHTAITRMIRAGIAPAEVMKISGHTQVQTFARYVNTDAETAKRTAAALSSMLEKNA